VCLPLAWAQTDEELPRGDPVFQFGVVLAEPGDLFDFEQTVGRNMEVFLWYQTIDQKLDKDVLEAIARGGRIIQISWEPIAKFSGAIDPADYRLTSITNGEHDAELRRWARELRNFGYPVQFRPMCEMNGDWNPWSGTANGNKRSDFVPAWRHIHDIFMQEGVTNVDWVWAPNRDGSSEDATETFNSYYPGDEYVDYIGINGYNWGTMYSTPTWVSFWQNLEEVFADSYDVYTDHTNKPIIFSEMASADVGGEREQWIKDSFEMMPARFPRVVSVIWFNLNKETDWRIESSPAGLSAFQAATEKMDTTIGLCGKPDLSLDVIAVYWASFDDYILRQLSVDFSVGNTGLNDADGLKIIVNHSSNGVQLRAISPLIIQTLGSGESEITTLKYQVPSGAGSYRTWINAEAFDHCGNIYKYRVFNKAGDLEISLAS
jgi:beta-mannanase